MRNRRIPFAGLVIAAFLVFAWTLPGVLDRVHGITRINVPGGGQIVFQRYAHGLTGICTEGELRALPNSRGQSVFYCRRQSIAAR